jgi:hypothetical protein
MDTRAYTDPGITFNAATENPADMNTNDASNQITDDYTTVTGTLANNTNSYIYFRIGLKSVNPGPAPRYGLIMLTYKDNSVRQLIYVRQGETPDKLFPDRPLAAKFSCYNLTATHNGGDAIGNHSQIGLNGGLWTDYPSQAGYLFMYAGVTPRRAFHPIIPEGTITGYDALQYDYWDNLKSNHETCPLGFRRPTNGSTSSLGSSGNGEITQSLLPDPTGTTSSTTNVISGYYADGFFDRRALVSVPDQTSFPLCCVSYSTTAAGRYVAVRGSVIFNPNTLQSIFFPLSGGRSVNNYTTLPDGYANNYSMGYNTTYRSASVHTVTYPTSSHNNIDRLLSINNNPSGMPQISLSAGSAVSANPIRCVEN